MKLKVYGGNFDGVNRVICAAPSLAAFHREMKAAGIASSMYHTRNYTCETGNEEELNLALSDPLAVFRKRDNFSGVFVKLEKKSA